MTETSVQQVIGLRDFRVECIIGAHKHERVEKRPLFIDISISGDFRTAACSDRLADAMDYETVAQLLADLAQRRFKLIESFAQAAVQMILEKFPSSMTVEIEVRKPKAIVDTSHAFVRWKQTRRTSSPIK